MRKIVKWLSSNQYLSPLSPGCRLCAQGAKMVLLITGYCTAHCYYCPLSIKKQGKDRIFADEWELKDEHETEILIKEAQLIGAKGAGITGGDPLLVLNRTCTYIQLLKETFGTSFHIHLYTPIIKEKKAINQFANAGLDELRFHPQPANWGHMEKSSLKDIIAHAKEYSLDVALEIPVIPKKEKDILSLIYWADKNQIDWINLNELEYSEGNYKKLNHLGYLYKNDISSSVLGSESTALNVIQHCSQQSITPGIHYCSSQFKDSIQLKNRITRRAKRTAKPYDVITPDGTLLRGIIQTKNDNSQTIKKLQKKYIIPPELIEIDTTKSRINIAAWILQDIAEDLKKQGFQCYMVEQYPTADHLEVERLEMPIN
jgi:pyruvate formate-lyase activating enzyme-like uncharacterized protein